MVAIIFASLVLLGVGLAFRMKVPDPKHEYMLSIYQHISYRADSQDRSAQGPKLARTA